MPRRYRRRRTTLYKPLKTTKYSSENYGSQVTIQNNAQQLGSANIELVPTIQGALGTRKIKNFTLRLIAEQTMIDDGQGNQGFDRARVAFFLVYVPEGTQISPVQYGNNSPALSLYEPNQNVIMSGIVDSNQTYTFKSRLARNLASGDTIGLVLVDLNVPSVGDTNTTPITFHINYAISF